MLRKGAISAAADRRGFGAGEGTWWEILQVNHTESLDELQHILVEPRHQSKLSDFRKLPRMLWFPFWFPCFL